uniref:Tetratricopeptide repeat protein n=1 Tax=Desulfatirhabdium butyrativorans TaxID=340467 RepID=A0A7C4VQV6_9BACT
MSKFRSVLLSGLVLLLWVSCSFGSSLNQISIRKPTILLAEAKSSASRNSEDPYPAVLDALREGNVSLAYRQIQTAIQNDPTNMEYQYVLAGIYMQMNRFEEADTIFQALLRTYPEEYRKCHFDLAGLAMQMGDDEQALSHLEQARPIDPGRADYEMGIIHIQNRRYAKAVELLDQALAEKPEIRYECLLQKGLALKQWGKGNEAKAVVQELLAMDLSPERRKEISKLEGEIEDTERANRRWMLSVNAGIQYDDNVSLEALDAVNVSPPGSKPSDKVDAAEMITLYGRTDIYRSNPWKAGFSYLHYQLLYNHMTQNNLLGSRPSAFVEYYAHPYFLSVEYGFSHYWVDGDPRVDIHGLYPRFSLSHGDRWQSEVYAGLENKFYMDTTPDGWHNFLGFNEYFRFNEGKSHIRFGGKIEQDDFKPSERGDILGYQVESGINFPIWKDRLQMDAAVIFLHRHFGFDINIDPDEERRDQEWHLNIQFFGKISKQMNVMCGVYQTWNDSNISNSMGIDPYHFRRGVSLFMINYNF